MSADAVATGMKESGKVGPAMKPPIFSSLIVREVVINRFNTVMELRKCSGTELLNKSLEALGAVRTVSLGGMRTPEPMDCDILELNLGSSFLKRISNVMVEFGWSVSDVLWTALEALEAKELRSRERIAAGTHRVVRLEANLEYLKELGRLPLTIPRTPSDLIGAAIRAFDALPLGCAPSAQPCCTGYIEVEIPAGQIAWLEGWSRQRGWPRSSILTTAFENYLTNLPDRGDDHGCASDDRVALSVPGSWSQLTRYDPSWRADWHGNGTGAAGSAIVRSIRPARF